MKDCIIDLEFGPYTTDHGVYIVATVMDHEGNTYSEEIYYDTLDECYDDISNLAAFGAVELEDDELEEDEYDA